MVSAGLMPGFLGASFSPDCSNNGSGSGNNNNNNEENGDNCGSLV